MNKHFILNGEFQRHTAAEYILNLPDAPVLEVVVREYTKPRTESQNSRYWATLTDGLRNISTIVAALSDRAGYTPLEVRRIIAGDIKEPERAAMMFVMKPEAAHEILKMIVGIPTSTKLGTKKFAEFHDQMEMEMAEIVGEVNAFFNT